MPGAPRLSSILLLKDLVPGVCSGCPRTLQSNTVNEVSGLGTLGGVGTPSATPQADELRFLTCRKAVVF